MSKVAFRYYRTEYLRREILKETGDIANKGADAVFDLAEMAPELRARIVDLLGEPGWRDGTPRYDLEVSGEPRFNSYAKKLEGFYGTTVELDADITTHEHLSAVLDMIDASRAKVQAMKDRLPEMIAEYEAEKAEEKRKEKEAEKIRWAEIEAQAATARAIREAKETEVRTWIETHGSEHLKKAIRAGYDCKRMYVLERGKVEHPEGVVDYANTSGWKSRACPSDAALDLAERVGGKVVWLTALPSEGLPPDDEDEENEEEYEDTFREREAVVVRNFLGEYDVVYFV